MDTPKDTFTHTRRSFLTGTASAALGASAAAARLARAAEGDFARWPVARQPAALADATAEMGVAPIRHVHPLRHEHLRPEGDPRRNRTPVDVRPRPPRR